MWATDDASRRRCTALRSARQRGLRAGGGAARPRRAQYVCAVFVCSLSSPGCYAPVVLVPRDTCHSDVCVPPCAPSRGVPWGVRRVPFPVCVLWGAVSAEAAAAAAACFFKHAWRKGGHAGHAPHTAPRTPHPAATPTKEKRIGRHKNEQWRGSHHTVWVLAMISGDGGGGGGEMATTAPRNTRTPSSPQGDDGGVVAVGIARRVSSGPTKRHRGVPSSSDHRLPCVRARPLLLPLPWLPPRQQKKKRGRKKDHTRHNTWLYVM